MFSETLLEIYIHSLYQGLLQPPPILAPEPKTFQSSLWLRKAQSEEIFIKRDQDHQHILHARGTSIPPPTQELHGHV
jgi:hypothetical protein